MMYSFSAEPGKLCALNRLVSSCSVKGAISADVMLKTGRMIITDYRGKSVFTSKVLQPDFTA